jgi:hypothetical protein
VVRRFTKAIIERAVIDKTKVPRKTRCTRHSIARELSTESGVEGFQKGEKETHRAQRADRTRNRSRRAAFALRATADNLRWLANRSSREWQA